MEVLQKELRSLNQTSRLTSAVNDVDQIIAELTAAREQVAASSSPPPRRRYYTDTPQH